MGYFSNGTEGDIYESEYCRKCVHHDHVPGEDEPCPIWTLHVFYNGDENSEIQDMLNTFIPQKGVHNEKCKMFITPIQLEDL